VYILIQLFLRTVVSVYPLVEQDGLYRSVTEDDTGGEEAVDNGKKDLDYAMLAIVGP
jgi:hypothetical protein